MPHESTPKAYSTERIHETTILARAGCEPQQRAEPTRFDFEHRSPSSPDISQLHPADRGPAPAEALGRGKHDRVIVMTLGQTSPNPFGRKNQLENTEGLNRLPRPYSKHIGAVWLLANVLVRQTAFDQQSIPHSLVRAHQRVRFRWISRTTYFEQRWTCAPSLSTPLSAGSASKAIPSASRGFCTGPTR